jgi:regulator of sirC expression with transglutaminase-like and TPR domain
MPQNLRLQLSRRGTIFRRNMGKGPIWTFEKIAEFFEKNGRWSDPHLMRRLSFLSYDFDHFELQAPPLERICRFLFEHNHFEPVSTATAQVDDVALPQFLQNRKGTPLVLGILFRVLGQRIGVRLDFIRCPDHFILKLRQQAESCFIDLISKAKPLTSTEMLNTIQKLRDRCEISTELSFETLTEDQVFVSYLNQLKEVAFRSKQDQLMVVILDLILKLDPKNLSILRERSLAKYRLQNFSEALLDLKRYFSFMNPDHPSDELTRIYSELQNHQTSH